MKYLKKISSAGVVSGRAYKLLKKIHGKSLIYVIRGCRDDNDLGLRATIAKLVIDIRRRKS